MKLKRVFKLILVFIIVAIGVYALSINKVNLDSFKIDNNEEIIDEEIVDIKEENNEIIESEENIETTKPEENKNDENKLEEDKNNEINKTEEIIDKKPSTSKPTEEVKEPEIEEEKPLTQAQLNNTKRNELQDKYSITIKYANEFTYYISNKKINYLTDENKINEQLNNLEAALKLYPSNFFKEMKDNNMALTILLIDKVSDNSFAGLTDRSLLYDIKILLTTNNFVQRTIHHEIMHYIESYVEIKNYPNDAFKEWTNYNGEGFVYGVFDDSKVYNQITNKYNANFVNSYAQTNRMEDLASTFEDIMSRAYKPVGCYDVGSPIYNKVVLLNKVLEDTYECVKTGGKYQWNRFI